MNRKLCKSFLIGIKIQCIAIVCIFFSLCPEHLAGYKQLRGDIEFVEQIPRSASGKILRRELVEMHKNASKI